MASAGARAYSGGLGVEPPARSRGRAPDQRVRGRSPPEAESLLAFVRTREMANLPSFPQICWQFGPKKRKNFTENSQTTFRKFAARGDRPPPWIRPCIWSSYSHIRYILKEYGSSSCMKVIGSRWRSQEQNGHNAAMYNTSRSISLKHTATKCACNMGFSVMANRVLSLPSLSHNWTWPLVTTCIFAGGRP